MASKWWLPSHNASVLMSSAAVVVCSRPMSCCFVLVPIIKSRPNHKGGPMVSIWSIPKSLPYHPHGCHGDLLMKGASCFWSLNCATIRHGGNRHATNPPRMGSNVGSSMGKSQGKSIVRGIQPARHVFISSKPELTTFVKYAWAQPHIA